MRLETLEFVVRRKPRILVVEADHEADRDLIVLEVIEERTAIGLAVERPARRVHDEPGLVLGGVDLPKLFQADAVSLLLACGVELEALKQHAPERAAAALGEERVFRGELHARLEGLGLLAVLADAHVAGGDAAHRAVVVVENLGGREAGIDLDAELLRLLAEPAAEIAEADDVVAVVLHRRQQKRVRHRKRAAGRQEHELLVGDRRVERCTFRFPIGNELIERARLDHRAGKDVRADFRAFLDHANGDLAPGRRRQLLQPDRGTQARGAGADDDDVERHRFAVGALSAHLPRSFD